MRPRPVRLAAALARGAVYIIAAILVVIGIAMAAIETGWAKNALRQLIVRQANNYLTATLDIGRFEGSIFRGIRLGDVRLTRDGTPLISIDEIALSYSIRELVTSGTTIRRLVLIHPRVTVEKQADGRWNLAALVRRDTSRNRQSGPGRPVHIESIDVQDGTVDLRDPLTFGAAHVPSHYGHLNAQLSFDYVPVAWTLDFARASWTGATDELTMKRLAGKIGNGPAGWTFDGLNVETLRSAFQMDGRVDRTVSPTRLDLTVDARQFDFQEWTGVLSGLRNLAIVGRFKTHLSGPLAQLATTLDMETNGGAVNGALVLDTTVPGWHGSGALDVRRLDVSHWFNRRDRPSDVTGRVTFNLDLRLGHWPVGPYTFDGSHARFMDYQADDLKARGELTPTEVRIAEATATAYASNVRVSSGAIGLDTPYPYRFAGTATHVDLRAVPKAVPVPHVESTLAFDYEVRGSFVDPFVTGSAKFHASTFLGARVADGAVGSIDTAVMPFRYAGEGDVSGVDLHRFGSGLDVGWLQEPAYAGTVSGHFRVAGSGADLATMELHGGGRIDRSDIFGGTLQNGQVTIDIADGSIEGSYDGGMAGINPAIALGDPIYDASLTGAGHARMAVKDLLTRETTIDDYSVDGSLDLRNSIVRRVVVDRGQLAAQMRGSTLDVSQLSMAGPALEATGNGRLEFDGQKSSQFDYQITRADLAGLKELLAQDASGTLVTAGQLTGPTTRLHLIGDGTLSSLDAAGVKALTTTAHYDATIPTDAPASAVVNADGRSTFVEAFGQQLQQVTGNVAYDGGRMTLDLQVLQSAVIAGHVASTFVVSTEARTIDVESLAIAFRRATWHLDAAAPVRIAWDDQSVSVRSLALADAASRQQLRVDGTWRSSGGGDLTVTARQLFLDTFAPESQQPVRYGGVVDFDARVGGTADHPLVSGTITVTNGRVRRLSYERLAGRIDYRDERFQLDLRLDQSPGVWLTAKGSVPVSLFDRSRPERPIDVAFESSQVSLTLIEGLTDVIRNVTGTVQLNVRAIGTSADPHFDGRVELANGGFTVVASGARYKNARGALQLASDRVGVESLHVEDRDGHALEVRGTLGTHEMRVGDVEIDVNARQFEVLRNEFGHIDLDAQLELRGRFETPRLEGRLTVTGGEVNVDRVLDRTLFQPYATQASPVDIPADVDALAALNPWDRLGLGIELHVPNTLRMIGDNVQVTPGTPLGLGNIKLRVLGDLYLYKDPQQPLYVTGSFDQVTGTYSFQGRRFDLDPVSSINFRGDLSPEVFVTVTRDISGVQTRVTIAGPLSQPELRLASTPPLDPSDILSLIVFNTSTNELSALQQRDLAVRAGTLAAGFLAAPVMSALERSLGISTLEIEPGADIRTGARVTVGNELAPGLVARFSRSFGENPYDEAQIEYYLSRILRLRATFSDASELMISPFRRVVDRAGIDLLVFFSF